MFIWNLSVALNSFIQTCSIEFFLVFSCLLGYITDGCVVPHLIHKSTKWHTLTDAFLKSSATGSGDIQGMSPQVCWTHKDLVTSYCDDCHVAGCRQCMLKHDSHSRKPIREHHIELSHVFEGLQNIRLSRERQIQVSVYLGISNPERNALSKLTIKQPTTDHN